MADVPAYGSKHTSSAFGRSDTRSATILEWQCSVSCAAKLRMTPNTEHRTPNTEHRTPNTEHRTPNTEHRTPITEDDHRRPTADRRSPLTLHRGAGLTLAGMSSIDRTTLALRTIRRSALYDLVVTAPFAT